MLHNDYMQEFIQKNLWNLIITFVAIITAWSFLNSRVANLEAKAYDQQQQIVQYSGLVERVIKLEENRQVVASDIKEIKDDLKDLKKHFEIK